jgi:hypothetical protein
MTEVFKKCRDPNCGESQLTDKDNCRKCGALLPTNAPENLPKPGAPSDVIVVEKKEKEFSEPPELCIDCLKTKGFGITLPIIIFAIIVAGTAILQVHDIKWYFYWLFWGIWIFATGITFYVAGKLLICYCTKNTNDYRDPALIFIFGLMIIIGFVASFVIIANMPSNFEWVDTVWFK